MTLVERIKKRLDLSEERERMTREYLKTGIILTQEEARELLALLERQGK